MDKCIDIQTIDSYFNEHTNIHIIKRIVSKSMLFTPSSPAANLIVSILP
jgi:hypothetical protein